MAKPKRTIDPDDSDDDVEFKPKAMRDTSSEQEQAPPEKKKAKQSVDVAEEGSGVEIMKNADKNEYFNLSDSRRLTVRPYSGKTLIDIREYYRDKSTGEWKPGSKGISLTTDQWKVLRDNMDVVSQMIKRV